MKRDIIWLTISSLVLAVTLFYKTSESKTIDSSENTALKLLIKHFRYGHSIPINGKEGIKDEYGNMISIDKISQKSSNLIFVFRVQITLPSLPSKTFLPI